MTRLEIAVALLANGVGWPGKEEVSTAFDVAELFIAEEARRMKLEVEHMVKTQPMVWQWPDGSWRKELPTATELEKQLGNKQEGKP